MAIVWALAGAFLGSISGAITGTDLRVTGIAVAGFVVAATALSLRFAVAPSRYPGDLQGDEAARAAFATSRGMPPGQTIPAVVSGVARGVGAVLLFGGPIWSAMIGATIKRRKGWK